MIKITNILFLTVFTFLTSTVAWSASPRYQVVGSWDSKKTITRGPCFFSLEQAKNEKAEMEQKYSGGNSQYIFWIENVCRETSAPKAHKSALDCISVTGDEVRSGVVTTIENSCSRKVRVSVAGIRFTVNPNSTIQGHILDNLTKSNAKFVD